MIRTTRIPVQIAVSLVALMAIALLAAVGARAASGTGASFSPQVQSVTPWKDNAQVTGWSSSLNRVFYNAQTPSGYFEAFSADPDGSDPTCLTCGAPNVPGPGTAGNRGVTDVSPDGQYMLVEVEAQHPGTVGAAWTRPDRGGDNNIWLATTDGAHFWQLTDIEAPGQFAYATMWARFDRTGDRIVWAQATSPAIGGLGDWELETADIVWSDGVPSLADITSIAPSSTSFYEPYGFTPDDQHIIFASDVDQTSWADMQIDEIGVDGTGLTQLTPAATGDSLDNYNEFAFFTPDGDSIIYGRTDGAISGGMDYWTMNPDGGNPQHLTFFEQPWNTESLGYGVVGSLAFDPSDPDVFITTVSGNDGADTNNAYMVTISRPSLLSGLAARYFAEPDFEDEVYAGVSNPSSGYMENVSPAPGVPVNDYSIRWSGQVTPPATGTYSFCLVAEWSAWLYLGGSELVDGAYSFGQRRCATVSATAGVPLPITLDYEHGPGTALMQLSWIPPGSSTPTQIPSAYLSPFSG